MTDQPDDTAVNPTVRNAIPKGFSAPGEDAGEGPDAGGPGPDDSGQKHSALVGFMSVPVHRRLPIRRSTLLMVVAFVGFGTLWYLYPPATSAAASGSGGGGRVCLAPGLCRGSTNVTPAPTTTTTTTTTPPTTTSTTTATPTTRAPSTSSTTTTSSPSPTTTGTSLPGAGVGGTGQTTTTAPGSGPGTSSTTTSTTR
jgi:hypothetical protein